LEPGLLTTVQDAGRSGFAHLGVPPSGACDPRALAVANLLLGNEPGAAMLEVTMAGPVLRVLATTVIALGGAELGARVREEGRPLRTNGSHTVRAGTHIEFTADSGGVGLRAYLAVAGGIDVPEVLGSRSTYVPSGFGGIEGRPLATGDRIVSRGRLEPDVAGRSWPAAMLSTDIDGAHVIRAVAGPHAERLDPVSWRWLTEDVWEVSARSDRTGIRLGGPALSARPATALEVTSQPMVWGAVQVPPGGEPIVLLADHQTVGGYAVPLVAITADRPTLGQLGAGDRLRFEIVGIEAAHAALHAAESELRAGAAACARTDPVDVT
jgi:antagonist of KipI